MSLLSYFFKKSTGGSVPAPTPTPEVTYTSVAEADKCIEEGNVFEDVGDFDAAHQKYQESLEFQPNYWRALMNIGLLYQIKNDHTQAEKFFVQAQNTAPNKYQTNYNLGRFYLLNNFPEKAISYLQNSLDLKPDFFEAATLLSDAFSEKNEVNKAIYFIDRAINLQPNHTGAIGNKAILLESLGRIDDAIALLKSHPNDEKLNLDTAQLEVKIGDIDAATPKFIRALKNPSAHTLNAYLMSSCYTEKIDQDFLIAQYKKINTILKNSPRNKSSKNKNTKKRIGFISADLCAHAVAYFIEPLLQNINKSKFDIYVFSATLKPDHITERLRKQSPQWFDIANLNSEQAAECIESQNIEILIDLSGHTANNRLVVLALKPAPVIATWLGYLATTGLEAVDYRIVDSFTDPIGLTENQHTEKLIRMMGTQWCYLPQPETPSVSPLPASSNGYITFGSYNQCAKLSTSCLKNWALLLTSTPDSRIVFFNIPEGRARQRIEEIFNILNVSSIRLKFQSRLNWKEYFNSFSQADIALDSWPYTGATTTCDALLMGLPVITMAGNRSVSRSGVSLLTALNKTEWIADNSNQFIEIGKNLASDISKLKNIRESLREEFLKSSITNSTDFARRFEEALDLMQPNADF